MTKPPPRTERVPARNAKATRPLLPVLAQNLETALAKNAEARRAREEKAAAKTRRRSSS